MKFDFSKLEIGKPSILIYSACSEIDFKKIFSKFGKIAHIDKYDIHIFGRKEHPYIRVIIHFQKWYVNSYACKARHELLSGNSINIKIGRHIYGDKYLKLVSYNSYCPFKKRKSLTIYNKTAKIQRIEMPWIKRYLRKEQCSQSFKRSIYKDGIYLPERVWSLIKNFTIPTKAQLKNCDTVFKNLTDFINEPILEIHFDNDKIIRNTFLDCYNIDLVFKKSKIDINNVVFALIFEKKSIMITGPSLYEVETLYNYSYTTKKTTSKLNWAIINEHIPIIKFLIKYGINVNESNISVAKKKGNQSILKLILEQYNNNKKDKFCVIPSTIENRNTYKGIDHGNPEKNKKKLNRFKCLKCDKYFNSRKGMRFHSC